MEVIATRPPKGYVWGAVTIQAWALARDARVVTPTIVPALIHEAGYLCLHKPVVEGCGLWTVSHIPSGQKIATLPTQALARQCIGLLATVDGLACMPPTSSALSKAWAIVSSLPSPSTPEPTSSTRRRPAKTPQDGPSSFSPVFRGYVPTPADRAAQNKAALAFGALWGGTSGTGRTATDRWGVLGAAAAIHWREEIMVRVTQPPRALLLETDIPSNGGSGIGDGISMLSLPTSAKAGAYTLRDGTPATPGEFRRRYHTLLDLGDRLRAGSLRFQTLYREGEAEGWTTERLDRWEAIDGKFVSLVCEGWMVWSGAAFCFDCAPEAFRRNVVAKLGFIGSRERGWAELGVKTFLRWPEIAECQPLRRELREKLGARL